MISVDDTDLSTYGLLIESGLPPRFAAEQSTELALPGAFGVVRTGGDVGSAEAVLAGTLVPATRTNAALRAALAAIAPMVRGERAIQFPHLADREWHGVLQALQTRAEDWKAQGQWIADASDVTLQFRFHDPLAIARVETVLVGTDVTLALGDAPCPLRIDVQNVGGTSMTQLVVKVYAGAQVLQTLTWTGTLAAGKTWSLDDEGFTVTNDGANAIDGLSADSPFPYADPAAGASRVTITATGSTVAAVVRYFARWLT